MQIFSKKSIFSEFFCISILSEIIIWFHFLYHRTTTTCQIFMFDNAIQSLNVGLFNELLTLKIKLLFWILVLLDQWKPEFLFPIHVKRNNCSAILRLISENHNRVSNFHVRQCAKIRISRAFQQAANFENQIIIFDFSCSRFGPLNLRIWVFTLYSLLIPCIQLWVTIY